MSKKLSKPQERKYNLIRGYLKNHTLILVGNDCTLLETLKKIWINKGRFYLWGRRDIRSSQGPRTIIDDNKQVTYGGLK